jgi:hypothetical protein
MEIATESRRKALVTRYIESVGRKELDVLASLLHPQMEFRGNITPSHGPKAEWIAAFQRLSPIIVRNDIRKIFVDGSEVCVIYDFVTTVCPVPSVEWIVIDGDRIRSTYLLFDRSRWPEVLHSLPRG